jgi:hypothetical protein
LTFKLLCYCFFMAQILLRFLVDFEFGTKKEIANLAKLAVAKVHYDIDQLAPGDVSLFVPILDIASSDSDAAYELEISEGSENWPRDPKTGLYLPYGVSGEKGPAELALDDRAKRISEILSGAFASDPHNVFEVTGIATGWYQYNPESKRR